MKEFTLPYSKKKATLNDTPLTTGGNCDFSIANVRIINDDEQTLEFIIPYLHHEVGPKSTKAGGSTPDCLMCEIFVEAESNITVEVPLYKGLYVYNNSFLGSTISDVDGDITFDENVLEITGDGSITITGRVV